MGLVVKRWRWWLFGVVLLYAVAVAWVKLNLDHCAFVMPLFAGDACKGWVDAWRLIVPSISLTK